MDLPKIIHLFESKHTESLSDRHASSINKLCKQYKHESRGFYYKDIPHIAKILNLWYSSFENGKYELVPALLNFIDLLKVPFKKEKSSDENSHVPRLPMLFNSLCPLMKFECPNDSVNYDNLTGAIANLITEFASYGIKELRDKEADETEKIIHGNESRIYKNGSRNLVGISKSEVPEALVNLLAENRKSIDVITLIIESIASCSVFESNSKKFSSMGVLKDLIMLMADAPDFRSYLVRVSMEAIFEIASNEGVQTMANEGEIILHLRRIFERVLKEGYKLDDKCLRNELAILINYIVSCPESHKYFTERETTDGNEENDSFLDVICYFATHDELNSTIKFVGEGSETATKAMFTTRDEDVEFKKLLWTSVLYIARDPNNAIAHEIITNREFVASLLMYVDPNNTTLASQRWQPPQMKEIQLHGLAILFNLVPLIPEHFHARDSHSIFIQFLATYSDYERKLSCLKVLLNSSEYDFFKIDLGDRGIMEFLLEIIQNVRNNSLYWRELAFNIVSNICKDTRSNQKEFRRKGGIEIIKDNLKMTEVDQTGNSNTFLLSVLDWLNFAVYGNSRSELHFLEIEGVYVLLDLLEEWGISLRRLVLSSMCTILQNGKVFKYFVEWNSSRTTINATQLLIRLYEEEDKRFKVEYANGIIDSNDRPLFPQTSYMDRKENEEIEEAQNQGSNMNASRKSLDMDGMGSRHSQRSVISNPPSKMGSQNHSINSRSSKGFKGLQQAIAYSNKMNKKTFSESYINKMMLDVSFTFDIRATIFCVFYRVGFDLHELTPSEKQRMEIIQLYPYLKNGEIWKDIKQELTDTNVKPTSDDEHWMETWIEEADEHLENAIYNQNLFSQEIQIKESEDLENYYSAIRMKNSIQGKSMNASSQHKSPSATASIGQ